MKAQLANLLFSAVSSLQLLCCGMPCQLDLGYSFGWSFNMQILTFLDCALSSPIFSAFGFSIVTVREWYPSPALLPNSTPVLTSDQFSACFQLIHLRVGALFLCFLSLTMPRALG
jgi:hypothetical protein